MKEQIIYFFDPLCGWCYGFSQVIFDFKEKYNNRFEFVAIPGGMMTGDRIKPYKELTDFVTQANPRVEQISGTKFGEDYKARFLNKDCTILTDSEPPSRGLLTLRSFIPDKGIECAHWLQKSHFFQGKDYNDPELYSELASAFALDQKEFMNRYKSDEIKKNVMEEFAWVKEAGIQGFPTVVYRLENKYYLLTHGYAELNQLETTLAKALKMVSK